MQVLRKRCERALVLGVIATLSTALSAGTSPVEPGDLLASTGQVGASLIEIDPDTGNGTFRFTINALGPVSAIEFRADGTLFGTTGGGSSSLIVIDPDTGDETLVGVHDFGAVNGLAFIGDTLFGSFFSPDGKGIGGSPTSLVTIDSTDGELTIIGELDFSPVRGLAWDPDNSLLYGVGAPFGKGVEGEITDVLFTIDPATAQTTVIGNTGLRLGGLTVGPDGLLYAGEAQVSAPEDAKGTPEGGASAALFVLNPQTGAPTLVGATGFPAISGLAFVPSGAPSTADLSLTKSVSPVGDVQLGANLTYTLEVSNAGPDPATGVVVTDALPIQVTYQSNSCGASEAGGTVTWNVGALAVSATEVCEIVVTASAPGMAVNSATAQGNEVDPNGANDTGSATNNIVAGTGVPEAQPIPAVRGPALLLMLILLGGIGMVMLARRNG